MATGVHGAVHNVLINLESITDAEYVSELRMKAETLAQGADELCHKILLLLEERSS